MNRMTRLLLVSGLTTFLLVTAIGVGIWLIAQNRQPTVPNPATVVETAASIATPDHSVELEAIQQNSADRAAAYQQQLIDLQTAIQTRETSYQTEIRKATEQLDALSTAVAQREENLTALNAQLQGLQTALADRQLTYQTQLSQTQTTLAERQAQLEAQVQEAQAALATANAQLGR